MSELLASRHLSKRFGGVQALGDVDVVVQRGETIGMIGPNGSGKTSFVNAVTGYLPLDGGTISFAGQDITGIKPHRIVEAGIVRTYQQVRVFSRLSVRRNLDMAHLMRGPVNGIDAAEEAALLEWLLLDRRLDALAGSLTLFEQRRLELAMRLVLRPQMILLDEPVGGLAPAEVRAMMGLLSELKAKCNVFIIEHTMKVIRELADRVIVLISGQKIADGPPAEILRDKRVIEHYLGARGA